MVGAEKIARPLDILRDREASADRRRLEMVVPEAEGGPVLVEHA